MQQIFATRKPLKINGVILFLFFKLEFRFLVVVGNLIDQFAAYIPSPPRDRPRPPFPACPSRSPAPQAFQAHCRDPSRHRPLERNPLARIFLQRLAIGRHRLFQLARPALPLAEACKRSAEIVLRHRPVAPINLSLGAVAASNDAAPLMSATCPPVSRRRWGRPSSSTSAGSFVSAPAA